MPSTLLPIDDVIRKLNIPERHIERCSSYGVKLKLSLLSDPAFQKRGKLIIVTATCPTKAGEGKTVTSVGLAQGLEKLGKRAIITSREPSLGPVFGQKGGGAGGGLARVEPAEEINLHFHGDFHAITSAHNLLSAVIDAHIFHGNELNLDPDKITWPRVMDMNDRALRRITVGGTKAARAEHKASFVITAASEIMAIMGLAKDRDDLRLRLDAIVVGLNRSGQPVRAAEFHATGSLMALLTDAIMPNLVQTTEGTPATVHIGPFANIAHGTSSIISQTMGLQLADYVVNECGFGSDLGAEKYFDLVMRYSGLTPSAAVLVTTVRSLKVQGQGSLSDGLPHLAKHIQILRGFGVPLVVGLNHFPDDTDDELKAVVEICSQLNVPIAFVEAFSKGGAGATDLAAKVIQAADSQAEKDVHSIYRLEDTLEQKITTVARQIYGAADVAFTDVAREKLDRLVSFGFGNLPICVAKNQYSLSDDAEKLGVPTGWTLGISDILLSAGAGFVVIVSGSIMLMPGLGKMQRGFNIDVDVDGNITGLT
jgi:formate--tetrahydrofolate ligase